MVLSHNIIMAIMILQKESQQALILKWQDYLKIICLTKKSPVKDWAKNIREKLIKSRVNLPLQIRFVVISFYR
jgi:hypothetical protein